MTERDRQFIALRANSPKRANPNKPIEPQKDAVHLPLFVVADEPRLF